MESNFFSSASNTTAVAAAGNTNNNFITTSANQHLIQPNMAAYYTHNSQNYLPPYTHQSMQFPYTFPPEQPDAQSFAPVYPVWLGQNGIQNAGGNNNGVPPPPPAVGSWHVQPNSIRVPKEPQRLLLDQQKTKIARIKRKLARQKSLSLQRNSTSGVSSSSSPSNVSSLSAHLDARRVVMHGVNSHRDLFKFCTANNKRLRVLLIKELKNSDVGSLGRIILPKREAEGNLPSLSDKEGIQIAVRDAYSDRVWILKFKYWCNNKSRMYVLENTGDFVKQNGLEIGDTLTLYEDEGKHLYFSVQKVARPVAEPTHQQPSYTDSNGNDNPVTMQQQARDEEEASLALLIEQLKHKEQQEETYYNLMTLPMDDASLRRLEEASVGCASNNNLTNPHHEVNFAATSLSHVNKLKNADDDHHQSAAIDDCYGCLGMLPDVDTYNFSV